MPQHKSAEKRLRQNAKRREHNKSRRSKMRTLIKNVLQSADKTEAEKNLNKAVSFIDRLSAKRIIHPNNAARKKARLTKHVNNL